MIDEEEEAVTELLSQPVKMKLKSREREDELNASMIVRLSINGLELTVSVVLSLDSPDENPVSLFCGQKQL